MTSEDVVEAREWYYYWEKECGQFRSAKRYRETQETLEKMISMVENCRTFFDEPDDRIRILQCRKLMLSYEEERLRGGRNLVSLLRESADVSTPSVCLKEPSQELDPICVSKRVDEETFQGSFELDAKCISKRETLSHRQAKMCDAKINAVCTALKIEAALAARSFDYQQALEKRRMAVQIHKSFLDLDPKNQNRINNQKYLEYWYYVTVGCCSLLKGQFSPSKEWFSKAREVGRVLNQKRCFPNYFQSLSEIVLHEFYIDALEEIRSAKFGNASCKFRKWLDLNEERKGKYDLRYDNICIFEKFCNILERLPKEKVQLVEWNELEQFLDRTYVAKTTWVLWRELQWLRELAFKSQQKDSVCLEFDLQSEVNKVAQKWNLFIFDTALLGEDRLAGLERHVTLPSFIDIFDHLDQFKHNWQQLLLQNLKNLFLLMADYEHKRNLNPPPEEAHHPRSELVPIPSEKMTIPKLGELILFYLDYRSKEHKNIFEKALSHLGSFISAIEEGNFTLAIAKQMDLLNVLRFWPHVILVKDQEEIPKPIFFDEKTTNYLARKTVVIRMWNREPKQIIFEGPQNLNKNSYYYLRPRWNVRSCEDYRIRHEQFYQSDLPRWINVFFENIFRKGKISSECFHDWILQFKDSERLLACQFFDILKFYNEDDIRELWLDIYRKKLPPEAKVRESAYFSLGHTAKSGSLNNYYFRQAMSKLPDNERSFEFKEAFREISEFGERKSSLLRSLFGEERKPRTVIFVDDFIGTGKQAIGMITKAFDRHKWLYDTLVYYCALVGFEDSIDEIKDELSEKIKDVFVGEKLNEKDRAFSDKNPIWKSDTEREQAKQWAEEIGRQVLKGNPNYDSERDKLGWFGSQALVAFHYNIPNNTLPLFWGTGERNRKRWKPLLDRYD